MLFPTTALAEFPVIEKYPSKTYRVSSGTKRILGTVDGVNAMIQAYDKLFSTERYAYAIYTGNYGIELDDLFGQPLDYCASVLEQRIRDALSADDRTISIENMEVSISGTDSLVAAFTVKTTEGEVTYERTVSLNGTG